MGTREIALDIFRLEHICQAAYFARGGPMADTANTPRRRPAVGGYARGEETRARIVAAALEVFGEEGYERASTRRIASQAGVSPPALQYYFDSKEGLHRACAEHLLAGAEGLTCALARAESSLATIDAQKAPEILCDVLEALVDTSLDRQADAGRAKFFARAQADGAGPALELMRARLGRPVEDVCVRLAAIALGRDPADIDVRLRAVLLLNQVSAVQGARKNTLALAGYANFEGERRQVVKRALRANTLAALRNADD